MYHHHEDRQCAPILLKEIFREIIQHAQLLLNFIQMQYQTWNSKFYLHIFFETVFIRVH